MVGLELGASHYDDYRKFNNTLLGDGPPKALLPFLIRFCERNRSNCLGGRTQPLPAGLT
jgi:hypothetical protein